MTSSQRTRELVTAKMRRARKLKLELENLVKDNQRKLIEATIAKTELRDDELEIYTDMNKVVLPSSSTGFPLRLERKAGWISLSRISHLSRRLV